MVIQVSPSVSFEGGRMIVPRFITMSIVGENLMVLIIGGHFADKQLKKAPQVGQGAYSSRSRQNGLFPRDNTTQRNITYLSESAVKFQIHLIDFIDMALSLQRWGPGSYSECCVVQTRAGEGSGLYGDGIHLTVPQKGVVIRLQTG